jgi:hypothetical protein
MNNVLLAYGVATTFIIGMCSTAIVYISITKTARVIRKITYIENVANNLRQTLLTTTNDYNYQLRRMNEHIYALKTTTKFNDHKLNLEELDRKYRDGKTIEEKPAQVKILQKADVNKTIEERILERVSARLKAVTDVEDTIVLVEEKGVDLKKNG